MTPGDADGGEGGGAGSISVVIGGETLGPLPLRGLQHHLSTELTVDPGRARLGLDARTTGRSRHDDVSVTRRPDALTPRLRRAAAAGERIPEVRLAVPAPGGTLGVELVDVFVTGALLTADQDGPLETLTLSYGQVAWAWRPAEPGEGGSGGRGDEAADAASPQAHGAREVRTRWSVHGPERA